MASSAALLSACALCGLLLLLLLQLPPALARFLDAASGLLDLAMCRRNMALLGHAILLLVLRDAGVLSGPCTSCRTRGGRPPAHSSVVLEPAAHAAAPALADAAPPAAQQQQQQGEELPEATKEIILVEKQASGNNNTDDHEQLRLPHSRPAADDDEMDMRFDRFIADTRRKMRLEGQRQLPDEVVEHRVLSSGKELISETMY